MDRHFNHRTMPKLTLFIKHFPGQLAAGQLAYPAQLYPAAAAGPSQLNVCIVNPPL